MNTFKHIVILLLLTGCTNVAVTGADNTVIVTPDVTIGVEAIPKEDEDADTE